MNYFKIGKSVVMLKKAGVIFVMIFSIFSNSACSYKTMKPEGKISLLLQEEQFSLFKQSINELAHENGLTLNDGSREYTSGVSPLLLQYFNLNGERVVKINDLMDKKRIVIAIYKSKHSDWRILNNIFLEHIRTKFPGTIQNDKIKGVGDT